MLKHIVKALKKVHKKVGASIFILIWTLASCQSFENNSTAEGLENIDSDEPVKIEKSKEDSTKSEHSYYFLTDINLRIIAEAILMDSISPSDNKITFNILDSISNKSLEARNFYYPVAIYIMKKSDGALSEVVGSYFKYYVENYTREFFNRYADCFKSDSCALETLRISDYIKYEIGMQTDVKGVLAEFKNRIYNKSDGFNKKQVEQFLQDVERHIEEYFPENQ